MLFTERQAAFFGGLLHLQILVMNSWTLNACAKALPRSTVSSLYNFKMNAISFIKSSRIKIIISLIRNIRLAKEIGRFHVYTSFDFSYQYLFYQKHKTGEEDRTFFLNHLIFGAQNDLRYADIDILVRAFKLNAKFELPKPSSHLRHKLRNRNR